ncbi:wnt inhibitory factor 1-like isoform X1 [Apostichopus japonicus]|uniref:wnt inhibitory factor 1-like isoform X1 n=2 Tax=Stichopus japonicus TaxID=307972 RepID=UPI003AB70D02
MRQSRVWSIYRKIMGNWKTMRGLYARLVITCAIVIIWTTVLMTGPQSEYGLEIWLDSRQSQVLDLDIPVYLISNGEPSALLSRAEGGSLTPVQRFKLPRDIAHLNITWRAPAGFQYEFEELASSDHVLMRAPTVNIPKRGMIPTQPNVLKIGFPCSGETSGIGYGKVVLRLSRLPNTIEIAPGYDVQKELGLAFEIEKDCRKSCHPPCQHEGICDDWGICICPEGYYGPLCEQVFCQPKCHNGGTCFTPGICVCPTGFNGAYCQKAMCTGNCNGRGTCIGHEKCYCRKGWSGQDCLIHDGPR